MLARYLRSVPCLAVLVAALIVFFTLTTSFHNGSSYGTLLGLKTHNATTTESSKLKNQSTPLKDNPTLPKTPQDPLCEGFPDTSGILPIVKTGATESFDRIPTQLATVLRCMPDFLLFSDMDQTIGGHPIYDILEGVVDKIKENNDFKLYWRQKDCVANLSGCQKLGDPAKEGWNLDKYKNVRMTEKTYSMRPNYKWYVFIDADTYVHWPNVVELFRDKDSDEQHFMGNAKFSPEGPFAHGGSGYLLSQGAMKAFVGSHPTIGDEWDERASRTCCGDWLFSMAMAETTNASLHSLYPSFNTGKPYNLPYGPILWCEPVVTMHHMDAEELTSFWEYDRNRYGKNLTAPSLLLWRDIYTDYVSSKIQAKREDWDNMFGGDIGKKWYYFDKNATDREWEKKLLENMKEGNLNDSEKKAHLSFNDCGKACNSVNDCFQYRWQENVCTMSSAFTLGDPVKREEEENKRMISGWATDKIKRFVTERADCGEFEWPDRGPGF